MDSNQEITQRFGEFYVPEVNDAEVEAALENRLLVTAIQCYDPRATEQDIMFTIVGTCEACRQFLFKYMDSLKDPTIMEKIDNTINALRFSELDKESMMQLYDELRNPLTLQLGLLGFRFRKTESFAWNKKAKPKEKKPVE